MGKLIDGTEIPLDMPNPLAGCDVLAVQIKDRTIDAVLAVIEEATDNIIELRDDSSATVILSIVTDKVKALKG